MSSCTRAQDLFGAYWDDETTQAEREWLESHLAGCTACRDSYEQLTRTLEAVASLPREEAAPDLAERALAAARRASPAPDRIFVRETPTWVPVTAAAAAVLLALVAVLPMLTSRTQAPQQVATRSTEVAKPQLAGTTAPQVATNESATTAESHAAARTAVSSILDPRASVDFVLDPVQLRRVNGNPVHLPNGVQGEQAVISY